MRFLLTGASGFLGSALRVRLAQEGHHVTRLVRRKTEAATEFRWDPDAGDLDPAALNGVDAVVNLSGTGVADRPWTNARKRLLLSSRVNPTRTLVEALTTRDSNQRPVLIQGSAIGWYGAEPTAVPHTEADPEGADWLSGLVHEWEAATAPAVAAGLRVVLLRSSPVLDRSGGLFRLLKLPFQVGLGTRFGDGSQHMALIGLADWLEAVCWAAQNDQADGPYNLTIPTPCTNAEFTRELAAALHRRAFIGAPAKPLRVILGDFAEQLVGDLHVVPDRLTSQGFRFSAPDVSTVIRQALHIST